MAYFYLLFLSERRYLFQLSSPGPTGGSKRRISMKKIVVVLCSLFIATFAIAQEEHGGEPVGEEHAGKAVEEHKGHKGKEHAGKPVGKESAKVKGKGKKKGLFKEHHRKPKGVKEKAHKKGKSKKSRRTY